MHYEKIYCSHHFDNTVWYCRSNPSDPEKTGQINGYLIVDTREKPNYEGINNWMPQIKIELNGPTTTYLLMGNPDFTHENHQNIYESPYHYKDVKTGIYSIAFSGSYYISNTHYTYVITTVVDSVNKKPVTVCENETCVLDTVVLYPGDKDYRYH